MGPSGGSATSNFPTFAAGSSSEIVYDMSEIVCFPDKTRIAKSFGNIFYTAHSKVQMTKDKDAFTEISKILVVLIYMSWIYHKY